MLRIMLNRGKRYFAFTALQDKLAFKIPEPKDTLDLLLSAIKNKNFYYVRKVLDAAPVSIQDKNILLKRATTTLDFQTVEYLFRDPIVNPVFSHNLFLRNVCKFGKLHLLEILLKDERVDPSYDNSDCLVAAGIESLRVDVLSNWGHQDYTCIYQIQVFS